MCVGGLEEVCHEPKKASGEDGVVVCTYGKTGLGRKVNRVLALIDWLWVDEGHKVEK